MVDQCCCGRFEPWPKDEQSIRINDTVHEAFGPEDASCGPWWKHRIRDQRKEIAGLGALVKALENPNGSPCASTGDGKDKDWLETPLGFCPECGAPGLVKERAVNVVCAANHVYNIKTAAFQPPEDDITPAMMDAGEIFAEEWLVGPERISTRLFVTVLYRDIRAAKD